REPVDQPHLLSHLHCHVCECVWLHYTAERGEKRSLLTSAPTHKAAKSKPHMHTHTHTHTLIHTHTHQGRPSASALHLHRHAAVRHMGGERGCGGGGGWE